MKTKYILKHNLDVFMSFNNDFLKNYFSRIKQFQKKYFSIPDMLQERTRLK